MKIGYFRVFIGFIRVVIRDQYFLKKKDTHEIFQDGGEFPFY